jgi:hypothetical protein
MNNCASNFKRRGVKVLEVQSSKFKVQSSKFKVQSSKFKKGGNHKLIEIVKTNNSKLRRYKDDNI